MIDNSGAMQPSLEIYDSQGNAAGQPLGGNYTGADVVSPAGGAYTVIASDAAGARPAAVSPWPCSARRTAAGRRRAGRSG